MTRSHFVAGFEVGVVAQLRCRDDTVRLESDVHNGLTVADGHDGAFDDFLFGELVEGFFIGLALGVDLGLVLFLALGIDGTPIEIL